MSAVLVPIKADDVDVGRVSAHRLYNPPCQYSLPCQIISYKYKYNKTTKATVHKHPSPTSISSSTGSHVGFKFLSTTLVFRTGTEWFPFATWNTRNGSEELHGIRSERYRELKRL
tara:strand:+ start:369 stop:713 length:345 start_codon:yes stop_codon:yes gene_type:complete